MTKPQQRLLAQIHGYLREAAYHRYAFEVQMQLKCCCASLAEVHQRQLDQLRSKVNGLLLDLMNSGISHAAFLRLIKQLEGVR